MDVIATVVASEVPGKIQIKLKGGNEETKGEKPQPAEN